MSCSTSNIAPLQLSFSNQSLTSSGEVHSNGIGIQLGTPPQLFGFTPSTTANNTFVNNLSICGSTANASCVQLIGGGFNQPGSSTARQTSLDGWNGTQESSLTNSGDIYLNDVMQVQSNTIWGYPFAVQPGNQQVAYAQLGLGLNSTFISALIDNGLAPSNSWSLYSGIYANSGNGGQLIIGGSSDQYYEGELYTKNMSSLPQDNPVLQSWVDAWSVQLVYDIVGLNWTTDNGTFDIMGTPASRGSTIGQELVMLLDPFYPTLTVPNSILWKWGNVTDGTWDPDMELHKYSQIPDGNLTVTIKDGLVTDIPASAIFDAPGYAYDNGYLAPYRTNDTLDTPYSLVAPWDFYGYSDYSNAALFGMPYAAMLYLIRDYERQTASIANANQDAQLGQGVTTICPLQSDNSGSGSGSSHVGAIAGGVVGGVVGLALIGVLIWFFLRRRSKKTKTSEEALSEPKPNEAIVGGRAELRPDSVVLPAYSEKDRAVRQSLLPNGEAHEMPNDTAISEAPGSPPAGEMSAEGSSKDFRAELPG